MVSCLLLAIGTLLWPAGRRIRMPGVAPGISPGRWRPAGHPAGSRSKRMVRVLGVIAAVGLLGPAAVAAGPAGLLAAGAIAATGWALATRAVAGRRRRRAMVDILAGLRMLGRELRAGAEPGTAAANAAAAASGDAVGVLGTMATLVRSDDRPVYRPVRDRRGRHGPATLREVETIDRRRRFDSPRVDPSTWTIDRLRSGWLLTRRHGLAFTPLIDALVQDLAEQLEADSERAAEVAGPRMSGYVMAALPLLGLLLGAGMGANPVAVLLGSSVGNVLLLVGVALTCAGLMWSARIVRH